MALIVQKYGGTSVGSTDKIKQVADRVVNTVKDGNKVVVVLSAMSGETDKLVKLTDSVSANKCSREYDLVISTGEQISIGLLSLALEELGIKAKSFLGHQAVIITDSCHGRARIKDIQAGNIMNAINNDTVAVVAGFQGVTEDGSITTLGRGGSDTTAVALASSLEADLCEINTDVEGVFTTDPRICSNAKKLKKVSYDEMLEMASLGAKVLQTRAVEFSKKYDIPLLVRSAFGEGEQGVGTLVCKEDSDMEKVAVSGVTYNKNEAKISVIGIPDQPGVAAKLFKPLTEAGINVDMIVQNISHAKLTDLTFTVVESDFERAFEIVKESGDEIKASDVKGDKNISKISIVGAGMRSHAGVASKMFETLSDADINMQMISTSEIKISCVVESASTEEAVKVLHDAFCLSTDEVVEEKV